MREMIAGSRRAVRGEGMEIVHDLLNLVVVTEFDLQDCLMGD